MPTNAEAQKTVAGNAAVVRTSKLERFIRSF